VLRVAQNLEDDAGMQRLPGMDGCDHFGHVTHTLDLSVNMSNASHYDVNDASQGFSIWTEDKPGTTKNWYFVLPNLVGTFLIRIANTRELPLNCHMVSLSVGMDG
jgi:hypothetical protein